MAFWNSQKSRKSWYHKYLYLAAITVFHIYDNLITPCVLLIVMKCAVAVTNILHLAAMFALSNLHSPLYSLFGRYIWFFSTFANSWWNYTHMCIYTEYQCLWSVKCQSQRFHIGSHILFFHICYHLSIMCILISTWMYNHHGVHNCKLYSGIQS